MVQQSGAGYGYTIEPFAAGPGAPLSPDFFAMRMPAEMTHGRIAVEATDGALRGERALRHVTPPPPALLFLPALLPLAVPLALHLGRRRSRPPAHAIAAK